MLKFTMVASVGLRGHFCLQIKSVDKKQVQTEDKEQLRFWMRWAKPVLWDTSNKTPTQFCGSRTTALLANLASSSCFITSFGILSRISASSRFWHSTTTWVVRRCPQHLGSTGCMAWIALGPKWVNGVTPRGTFSQLLLLSHFCSTGFFRV